MITKEKPSKKSKLPASRGGENHYVAKAWQEFRASALPAMPSELSMRLKIKDPEEMYSRTVEYFAECNKLHHPYSMAGLYLAWGVNSSIVCRTYSDRDGYREIIQWAKAVVEKQLENGLWVPKIAAGISFSLKNHFGWVDKHEVEHSGSVDFAHWLKTTVDPNAKKEEGESVQVEVMN